MNTYQTVIENAIHHTKELEEGANFFGETNPEEKIKELKDFVKNFEKLPEIYLHLNDSDYKKIYRYVKEKGIVTDGCLCGDVGVEIRDGVFVYAYVSCRKSSNTPDKQSWQVHEPHFYSKIELKNIQGDKVVETNYTDLLKVVITQEESAKIERSIDAGIHNYYDQDKYWYFEDDYDEFEEELVVLLDGKYEKEEDRYNEYVRLKRIYEK